MFFTVSRQVNQQIDNLQEQLHSVAGQRDEAVMQVAAAQEQAQQYATSLDNLQMVLEQFQRGRIDRCKVMMNINDKLLSICMLLCTKKNNGNGLLIETSCTILVLFKIQYLRVPRWKGLVYFYPSFHGGIHISYQHTPRLNFNNRLSIDYCQTI